METSLRNLEKVKYRCMKCGKILTAADLERESTEIAFRCENCYGRIFEKLPAEMVVRRYRAI